MSFADSYLGGLRTLVGSRPLISVGVRVLIEDHEGRFLVTQRANSGAWCLPGGSMELGESLLDAVHREAYEEANVTLHGVEAFGISSDPTIERHTYPNGDIVQNVSLLAHAHLNDGEVRSNDGEAYEFRFVLHAEVEEESFVKTEYRTFELWRRYRETGRFQVV